MVQQTDFEGNTSHDTQASVDLDVTTVSDGQFENEIHLSANKSRETSPRKLSSPQRSLSPQQNVNNTSITTPEKNTSNDTLSSSVWGQMSKKPVEGTPRTSTPEPRKSVSPRGEQQTLRAFYYEPFHKRSSAVRRKPFYDSTATNGVNSTQEVNEEKLVLPTTEFSTLQSRHEESSKKHWYIDIIQRLEDLSWSYQTMEVEYSFLEKLMAEQKEDLKKARGWNNRLRNQHASHRANKAH